MGEQGPAGAGDLPPLNKVRYCPQLADGATGAQRDSATCLGHRKATVGFSKVLCCEKQGLTLTWISQLVGCVGYMWGVGS